MNIISLFDGMSCAMIALQRLGIKPDNYFASEIDKYAIQVSKANWPEIVHMGDVTKVHYFEGVLYTEFGNYEVDFNDGLLCGGSPCQGFSFAGKQLNFEDPRSKLFFEFVRIWKEIKAECPTVKVFLENVVMKKEYQAVITDYLDIESILVDSALVSAQNRKRIYWTDIPFPGQPKDRKIFLEDIVLEDAEPIVLHNLYGGFKENSVRTFTGKSPTLRTNSGGGAVPSFVKKDWHLSQKAIDYMNREVAGGRNHWDFAHHSDIRNDKSAVVVVANFFKGVPYNVFKDWDCIRHFHPIECERLQCVPDNYTASVSTGQRYKMLGNGWNVDTIVHLFEPLLWLDVI